MVSCVNPSVLSMNRNVSSGEEHDFLVSPGVGSSHATQGPLPDYETDWDSLTDSDAAQYISPDEQVMAGALVKMSFASAPPPPNGGVSNSDPAMVSFDAAPCRLLQVSDTPEQSFDAFYRPVHGSAQPYTSFRPAAPPLFNGGVVGFNPASSAYSRDSELLERPVPTPNAAAGPINGFCSPGQTDECCEEACPGNKTCEDAEGDFLPCGYCGNAFDKECARNDHLIRDHNIDPGVFVSDTTGVNRSFAPSSHGLVGTGSCYSGPASNPDNMDLSIADIDPAMFQDNRAAVHIGPGFSQHVAGPPFLANQPPFDYYQAQWQPRRGSLPPGQMALPTGPLMLSVDPAMPAAPLPTPSPTLVCGWIEGLHPNPCGKAFHDTFSLHQHVLEEHAGLSVTGKTRRGARKHPLICCWVGCERAQEHRAFDQTQHLKDHMVTHTRYRPVPCEYCEKTFKDHKELNQHMIKHTGEKRFPCPVEGCGKVYAHPQSRKEHEHEAHRGIKRFVCEYPGCEQATNNKANHMRHQQTHLEPRWICHMCGESSTKKSNLKRHHGSCKQRPIEPPNVCPPPPGKTAATVAGMKSIFPDGKREWVWPGKPIPLRPKSKSPARSPKSKLPACSPKSKSSAASSPAASSATMMSRSSSTRSSVAEAMPAGDMALPKFVAPSLPVSMLGHAASTFPLLG